MTVARRELASLVATPYYQCISRCVRRALLCGEDSLTGKSYEHREVWVIQRLSALTGIVAIDIGAFAVMSNHCHLMLRVDKARAAAWSTSEVSTRWERLFNLPLLLEYCLSGKTMRQAENHEAEEAIQHRYSRGQGAAPCAPPLASGRHVSTCCTRAWSAFSPPLCRRRLGGKQVTARLIPG